MPQPAPRRGIRAAEALGLTIFLITAAFLVVLLGSWLAKGPDDFQDLALLFSTGCGVAAAIAMLIDAGDLWLFGRRMAPRTVKNVRMLVWVAVLGALAASLLGKNSMLVLYLGPAMITYLFISRRPPVGARAQAVRGGGASAPGRASAGATSTAKGRQRRGGRKRR